MKQRSRRSLLQSEPGHVLCDTDFNSNCGNREEFLNACKEHEGENWQFLPSSDYQFLVKLSGVQRFSEKETSIRSCYAKLKEDVDAVSWFNKVCHFVKEASSSEVEKIQDIYEEVLQEVPSDVVDGVALFKKVPKPP